jgi:hypothetical protein
VPSHCSCQGLHWWCRFVSHSGIGRCLSVCTVSLIRSSGGTSLSRRRRLVLLNFISPLCF